MQATVPSETPTEATGSGTPLGERMAATTLLGVGAATCC
jgi:hypothetical protein